MIGDQTNSTKIHLSLLFIIIVVLIWSIIKPFRYMNWAAECVPTLIGLFILIITYHRFRLTTMSYVIITLLSILMLIGGHYTFAKVPLFDWIKEAFDLKRNDYDRFSHFLKGLFTIVIREFLIRKVRIERGALLAIISVGILLSIAALYEILEMIFYKILKGSQVSQRFLGMQGDIWDSDWDMTVALIGSILSLLLLSKLHDKALKKLKNEREI